MPTSELAEAEFDVVETEEADTNGRRSIEGSKVPCT